MAHGHRRKDIQIIETEAERRGLEKLAAALMSALRDRVHGGCAFNACNKVCHEQDQHLVLELQHNLNSRLPEWPRT